MLSNVHPKYRLAVNPKKASAYNYIHDCVDGEIVTVIDLTVGKRGWIAIERGIDSWHRLHTSIVEQVELLDNGDIRLTTMNTVYVLNKIT